MMICSLTEPGSGRTTGAGKIVTSQRRSFGIVPFLRGVLAPFWDDAVFVKQLSILGSSPSLAQ